MLLGRVWTTGDYSAMLHPVVHAERYDIHDPYSYKWRSCGENNVQSDATVCPMWAGLDDVSRDTDSFRAGVR